MRSGEAAQFCLQEGPITAYIDAICFKICRIPQQINCFRGLKFRTFMTQKPPFIYGIAAWMILNIVLMGIILLNGDTAGLNNWIEIVLWATSIAGLLTLYGTHLVSNGITETEQNLVCGRIASSIFVKHYWSPQLKLLGDRINKALVTVENSKKPLSLIDQAN